MGIDWEYLLDAEGEDLQAAYDDHCDDSFWGDGWEEEPPIWDEPPDPVPEDLRGTRAAGEIVLARSAPFREGRLRLYCQPAVNHQPVDYLAAADSAPLLAILLTDDGQTDYSEDGCGGVPLLRLPEEDMEQGAVQEAVSRLTSILAAQRGEPAPVQHRIEPVPVELHARMAGLRMIQRRDGPLWGPTPYGRSLGVLDGYLPSDHGYCHTLFAAAEHKAGLDAALAFGQRRETLFQSRLPWEQTLLRARQGLPRSDACAVGIARAFASMPLADYMASCPEELELLRGKFPLDGAAAYQEAADCVFQFCVDQGGSDQYQCMNLILALTRPALLALSATPRPVI